MNNKRKVHLFTLVALAIVFIVFQILFTKGLIDRTTKELVYTIGINIILALGLNLVVGIAGQFSLGHAGFMAIGAYSAAIVIVKNPTYLGLVLGTIIGILITIIVALIVAVPTLRLQGDYLAIATLGAAEIIRSVILNLDSITNGARGISNIPKMNNWTVTFIFIVIVALMIVNYGLSSSGRVTRAIRDDEIAATSSGVNTTKYKILAFVIAAVTASIGGSLYATTSSIVMLSSFDFNRTIDVLIIVVFGGIGSLSGTVIAAILLGLINSFLQSYGPLRMVIYSAALILMMIFRPEGLLGRKELPFGKLLRLKEEDYEHPTS